MEGEAIGLVLGRASDLRCKINNCIDRATRFVNRGGEPDPCDGGGGEGDGGGGGTEEEEEEAESLHHIRDALESLEQQLAALQALQLQQRYERESTLAQIDRSRVVLLHKLKEYKGEDLEVIHEVSAFAGETIEHDDDLLLPPYPSDISDSFVLDDLYPSSHFTSNHKLTRNGPTGDTIHGTKKSMDESEKKQSKQPADRNRPNGIRLLIGLVAKSVLTFASVISVLGLAGFKPVLIKRGTQFKVPELFHKPAGEERHVSVQCPPGKVLVIEDGISRCLVKERVEIPFDQDITAPSISYGFG